MDLTPAGFPEDFAPPRRRDFATVNTQMVCSFVFCFLLRTCSIFHLFIIYLFQELYIQ